MSLVQHLGTPARFMRDLSAAFLSVYQRTNQPTNKPNKRLLVGSPVARCATGWLAGCAHTYICTYEWVALSHMADRSEQTLRRQESCEIVFAKHKIKIKIVREGETRFCSPSRTCHVCLYALLPIYLCCQLACDISVVFFFVSFLIACIVVVVAVAVVVLYVNGYSIKFDFWFCRHFNIRFF